MSKLFVMNEKEEFICKINVDLLPNFPEMITVTEYTRDQKYITGTDARSVFNISPLSVDDRPGFQRFSKYLVERGKVN